MDISISEMLEVLQNAFPLCLNKDFSNTDETSQLCFLTSVLLLRKIYDFWSLKEKEIVNHRNDLCNGTMATVRV